MAYDGKIAGHFPGRGNPNLDTNCIKYLREGASTPTSVSQMDTVKEVYAVGVNETPTLQTLDNYLVWRYFDELQNDGTTDQYLMFAIKPERNISVNSISILTDSNGSGSGSTALCIVSDDGLLLYNGNDTQESTENKTIYGYSGIKRTRTFSNSITLYSGKTYWIHYHFSDCRNHRGPYFNGFDGHACLGKYKNMNNFDFATFANQTTHSEYANTNFTFIDITNSTASSNSEKMDKTLAAAAGAALYFNMEAWDPFYIRNSYLKDHPYKGMVISTNNDGWSLTQEQWDSLLLNNNDYFMIRNAHNSQSYRICQCSNPTGDPNSSYTTITESEQELYKSSDFTTKLDYSKNVFIQYYNNGNYASNWNQTYTDKRFYLEINGNERCAGDERK